MVVLFFFQAEDGIRDLIVTGVQTCALPISRLTIDWPFPRVEPCLLFLKIDSTMGERRREITYDCVRHVRCNDSGGILVVMRLVNTLDQRPDIGFIFRTLRFQCYG